MFKKFNTAVCAIGVVLLTAGVASAQSATQEAKSKAKTSAQKTGNALSDAEITAAVKTKLLADKTVGGLKLDVDTSHGVVTLTGPVSSAAERAQAIKLARTTDGVKRVVNKLTIGKTEATSGHVAADTTTADTTKKDETKIIIKDDTTPAVKKGAEKTKEVSKDVAGKTADVAKDVADKTADLAKDVAGKSSDAAKKTGKAVKDTKVEVKDDATPKAKKAGEAVEDGSISTAVKTRLMTDEVARGTSIDVDTKDGVVTISGTVPTAADRTRIGQLVEKTTGVKSVVNNLKVK